MHAKRFEAEEVSGAKRGLCAVRGMASSSYER